MDFRIYYQLRQDAGEDAPPLIEPNVLGAFDGMGGAGGGEYLVNGEKRTGAYLASRAVSGIVKEFCRDRISLGRLAGLADPQIQNEITSELCLHIDAKLKEYAEACNIQSNSRIRGAMIKLLPTTMAAIIYDDSGKDAINALCIWAGDSRCYALTEEGVQQLSTDNLAMDNDAMKNLIEDSPMSNCIHIQPGSDRCNFKLYSRFVKIPKPCALFCATDGCFGYFKSPMHFEEAVLASIMSGLKAGNSIELLQSTLFNAITSVTADDCSIAGRIFLHSGNIKDFSKKIAARQYNLNENYISRFPDAPGLSGEKNADLIGAENKRKTAYNDLALAVEKPLFKALESFITCGEKQSDLPESLKKEATILRAVEACRDIKIDEKLEQQKIKLATATYNSFVSDYLDEQSRINPYDIVLGDYVQARKAERAFAGKIMEESGKHVEKWRQSANEVAVLLQDMSKYAMFRGMFDDVSALDVLSRVIDFIDSCHSGEINQKWIELSDVTKSMYEKAKNSFGDNIAKAYSDFTSLWGKSPLFRVNSQFPYVSDATKQSLDRYWKVKKECDQSEEKGRKGYFAEYFERNKNAIISAAVKLMTPEDANKLGCKKQFGNYENAYNQYAEISARIDAERESVRAQIEDLWRSYKPVYEKYLRNY